MELMTTKEAADFLGVSTMTIYRYLKDGKLIGYQYNRDIKIDKDSVIKLVQNSKIGGKDNE